MPSTYSLVQSELGIKYKIVAKVTDNSISLAVSGKPEVTLQWKSGKRVYSWIKRTDRTEYDVEVQIAILKEITRLANILERNNPKLKITHDELMKKLNMWEKTEKKKPRLLGRGFRRKV